MSLCTSIDTLAMAFLDDELAHEERREIELHLLDCPACRQHVDGERADLEMMRKALVAPPAPMMLKARIARALDAEDEAAVRSSRRGMLSWLLPGSAMAAAAAAILVFVGLGAPNTSKQMTALTDVAKQQTHRAPLEVQGASTGPWLQTNFSPGVEPPQFAEPGIALLGARLLPNGIANHDAALLSYLVTIGDERVTLTAAVLKDVHGEDFSEGQGYRMGDLVLRLHDANGMPAVTYVDPNNNVGYVFASERLTADELMRLVATTDLISRARRGR